MLTEEQKKKMELENKKITENMSGLICPECGHLIDLFGSGGGKKQAEEMDVDFLGVIPINIQARQLADEGKPVILENVKSDISIAIMGIVKKIDDLVKKENESVVV